MHTERTNRADEGLTTFGHLAGQALQQCSTAPSIEPRRIAGCGAGSAVTGELAAAGEVTAPRQAGTILSPFIYLTAFTRGMGPASLVWDVPGNLPDELNGYGNFDGTYHGPMRVRTAVAYDHVIPLLGTLQQVGTANAWLTAHQSGVESLSQLSLE